MKEYREQHTANSILMVRPSAFGYNPETAEDNAFQKQDDRLDKKEVHRKATLEFDNMVAMLRRHGISIVVIDDDPLAKTTDAVFPNNWVSFHEDGAIITYPMLSKNRRKERRSEIVKSMIDDFNFKQHLTLEHFEESSLYLEGTGSMVLDRHFKVAYAAISERTCIDPLQLFCDLKGYKPITFHAQDRDGQPVYHSNVMMCVGRDFVVICMDAITDPIERKTLSDQFEKTSKEVIEITLDQMHSFAGNMLQVKNKNGQFYLIMSSQAYLSLTDKQLAKIEARTAILHSPLDTIEGFGGGSARCMMAEIFPPSVTKSEA